MYLKTPIINLIYITALLTGLTACNQQGPTPAAQKHS
jgi:predicted small lipoprotein YifL